MESELVKVSWSFANKEGELRFPSPWMRSDLINTEIPDESDLFLQTAGQKYPIGTQLRLGQNLYRYSKAGAAMADRGFLKGNYFQIPGKAGNSANSGFEGAMYAAAAAGATNFTIADTAAAKNEYENALLVIYNDTDTIYDQYVILGNDVTNATTTKLYIASPGFKYAVTTSYGITIYRNEYMGIRTMTGGYMSCLGYAGLNITSAYYFWLKTAGRISGITGASTWPGQTQYYRDVYCNTDGSLIGYTAGYQKVGYLLGRTASDYGDNCIMLQLDQ